MFVDGLVERLELNYDTPRLNPDYSKEHYRAFHGWTGQSVQPGQRRNVYTGVSSSAAVFSDRCLAR